MEFLLSIPDKGDAKDGGQDIAIRKYPMKKSKNFVLTMHPCLTVPSKFTPSKTPSKNGIKIDVPKQIRP